MNSRFLRGAEFDGLCSIIDLHNDDRSWEITKAYNYGVIMGKRMERARRKRNQQ
ncbi:hypothetical protein [Selenomonas sp. oral taxon 126]|uniref:hypothetical protein n=1 Tax=Selenomonas sp. oral taxon 126 TaxID=712528 RepID=UPI0012ECE1A4|nr:hypothetical protein [Selenomonas sp. oral taxon 126]